MKSEFEKLFNECRFVPFMVLSIACLTGFMRFELVSRDSIKVTSLAELQKAVNGAKPGNHIILASGTYETRSPINITRQGTASKPIIISAEHTGDATITGTSGFSIKAPSRHVVVKGFVFKHAADSSDRIQYGAEHCRFTGNVFDLYGDIGPYLRVAGDGAEIDHNTFQNKSVEGRMLLVEGSGGERMARNVWVHHNLFKNFKNTGKNNSSAIQFGRSWSSLTPADGLIEHNLFLESRGENENVALKASNCIVRYNTFGAGSSELSLRHGNHNKVYGNFFFDTEGIRIFGDDHQIFSNYFEGNSRAIHIGNGDGEVADGAKLTAHDRPDRDKIVFNTLVNNAQNFYMGGRENGLGATNTTIAYNIIQGGGKLAEIHGPDATAIWKGNIVWNTLGEGVPAEGYTSIDPLLIKNKSTFHIRERSPAIDVVADSYDYVNIDMDGQKRWPNLDAGADEISSGPGTNYPLTVNDVGPNSR